MIEEMLTLHRQLAAARQIDRLVYELYGLMEAENRLVEKD